MSSFSEIRNGNTEGTPQMSSSSCSSSEHVKQSTNRTKKSKFSNTNGQSSSIKSDIIFLGTGSSSGTPHLTHIMLKPDDTRYNDAAAINSRLASIGDPANNPNYRCNPSLLIKYRHKSNDDEQVLIIDVGKTFREAAVRWFPRHDITKVDAILLTHGHADAFFGLDDVRSIQEHNVTGALKPMDVYLTEETQITVKRMFSYLFPKPPSKKDEFVRCVSNINWNSMFHYEKFSPLTGLDVTPIPVMHGEDMECTGFIFGKKDVIVYLSDISRMIPKTLDVIKGYGEISLLVVDALHPTDSYFSHFSMNDAIKLAKVIRPRMTRLVGMSGHFEHIACNKKLAELKQKEGLDIQLAFDGMKIEMEL